MDTILNGIFYEVVNRELCSRKRQLQNIYICRKLISQDQRRREYPDFIFNRKDFITENVNFLVRVIILKIFLRLG